jgi:hypothetical protein
MALMRLVLQDLSQPLQVVTTLAGTAGMRGSSDGTGPAARFILAMAVDNGNEAGAPVCLPSCHALRPRCSRGDPRTPRRVGRRRHLRTTAASQGYVGRLRGWSQRGWTHRRRECSRVRRRENPAIRMVVSSQPMRWEPRAGKRMPGRASGASACNSGPARCRSSAAEWPDVTEQSQTVTTSTSTPRASISRARSSGSLVMMRSVSSASSAT